MQPDTSFWNDIFQHIVLFINNLQIDKVFIILLDGFSKNIDNGRFFYLKPGVLHTFKYILIQNDKSR